MLSALALLSLAVGAALRFLVMGDVAHVPAESLGTVVMTVSLVVVLLSLGQRLAIPPRRRADATILAGTREDADLSAIFRDHQRRASRR